MRDDRSNLDLLQRDIGDWGRATFPVRDPQAIIRHIRRELDELSESLDPEEAADCLILLAQLADVQGFSLMEAARKKHIVNLGRSWKPADEEGVYRHDKARR
jgi:hypothetical protein